MLELTSVGSSGFAAGHADLHSLGAFCCRLTLAAPDLDREVLLNNLSVKASLYIEECIASLSKAQGLPAAEVPEGSSTPSTHGLWRLIYASRARVLLDSDVQAILATARSFNHYQKITGALCFLDGVYLQYLEGDHQAVESLYKKIARDKRHYMPKVIERASIVDREFGSWSMALLEWDGEMRKIVRDHNLTGELDLYLIEESNAASMLRAMTQAEGWTELQ